MENAKIEKLRKELGVEEQKQWDDMEDKSKVADAYRAVSKIYKLGLEAEYDALEKYTDLLSCTCTCELLDEDDIKSIREIIADELNHVRKLERITKKIIPVKAAIR